MLRDRAARTAGTRAPHSSGACAGALYKSRFTSNSNETYCGMQVGSWCRNRSVARNIYRLICYGSGCRRAPSPADAAKSAGRGRGVWRPPSVRPPVCAPGVAEPPDVSVTTRRRVSSWIWGSLRGSRSVRSRPRGSFAVAEVRGRPKDPARAPGGRPAARKPAPSRVGEGLAARTAGRPTLRRALRRNDSPAAAAGRASNREIRHPLRRRTRGEDGSRGRDPSSPSWSREWCQSVWRRASLGMVPAARSAGRVAATSATATRATPPAA